MHTHKKADLRKDQQHFRLSTAGYPDPACLFTSSVQIVGM